MRLQGAFTALITPFAGGRVDERALRRLIRRQLRAGIHGLVPCGSTGEAATLSHEEYRRVVEITVEEAGGRVPVVPGAGTNSTEKTAAACRLAESLGADAVLVLVPYYNKPTQEGMFQHFSAAARAVKVPVIVYNIPGRTGVNLQPATLARIARAHKNITTTKEAAGSLDQVSEILSLCAPGFTVLSGDDSLTLPMMSVGAKGVISVASNVVPGEVVRLCEAALSGDYRAAARAHLRLYPLFKALFLETNPIPVKAAVSWTGLCSDEMRLPLVPMSREPRKKLKHALKGFKL